MTFKKWFDDMQERYQAYYGGYEGLLQEAFEAGANQEREWLLGYIQEHQPSCEQISNAIRTRGQA